MRKIKQVQGIRAIAIFMVLISHTVWAITDNSLVISRVSQWGGLGVYIFVLLSGILLALNEEKYTFCGTLQEGIFFSIGKIKKLYLLHIVTYIVRALMLFSRGEISATRFFIYSVFNLTLTQSYVPFSGIINSFNGPSWYLSMCGFIWIATPVFIAWYRDRCSKQNLRWMLLCNIMLQVVWLVLSNFAIEFCIKHFSWINPTWFDGWLLYYCPLLNYQIYILGFIACKYFLIKVDTYSQNHTAFAIAMGILIEEMVFGYFKQNTFLGHIPVLLAITFALLYITLGQNVLAQSLSKQMIVHIGNISGFAFLIHGPISFFVSYLGLPRGISFLVIVVMTLTLSELWGIMGNCSFSSHRKQQLLEKSAYNISNNDVE